MNLVIILYLFDSIEHIQGGLKSDIRQEEFLDGTKRCVSQAEFSPSSRGQEGQNSRT